MESVEVIYEDNHLLVVNKPGGMLVQGDYTGDTSLLDWGKKYIKEKYEKPGNVFLGLPHRIDRVTSGVVILCRTSKSLSRVSQGFKEKKYDKQYLAIVPPALLLEFKGQWKDKLFKNTKLNKSRVIRTSKDPYWNKAKEAILDYEILGSSQEATLVKIILETGRHHQIRVQFSARKAPIYGDLKYGSKKGYGQYIALHAWRISGIHPVTKLPFIFEAPIPVLEPWNEFANIINENNE